MIFDYYLMHKDDIVAIISLDERGTMVDYALSKSNHELAPFCKDIENGGLKNWWGARFIPLKREGLADLLKRNKISVPEEYMVKNLGLSLTDHYWICPVNEIILWKDINLFDNDFKAEMTLSKQTGLDDVISGYTADSTLNGDLEKTWKILRISPEKEVLPWFVDGARCLVKGNSTRYEYQSINELIMGQICDSQGYSGYARYRLVKIKGKPYKYGCLTPNFCEKKQELISAAALIDVCLSPKENAYETFIASCTERGMEEEPLREGLDFMIMADFLMSNEDRHMNNIGVLRNADTLQLEQLAPIFDSGNSMFFNSIPFTDRSALMNLDTNSFERTELKMLSLVRNPDLIDVAALPDGNQITEFYNKIIPARAEQNAKIGQAFEVKKALLYDFQRGRLIDKNGEKIETYPWQES